MTFFFRWTWHRFVQASIQLRLDHHTLTEPSPSVWLKTLQSFQGEPKMTHTHTRKCKYGRMSKMRLMLNMSLYIFVSHYSIASFRFEYGKACHAATLKILIILLLNEITVLLVCLLTCLFACFLFACLVVVCRVPTMNYLFYKFSRMVSYPYERSSFQRTS